MFCFEDLEYVLADRMKSVAILILAVLVLILKAACGPDVTGATPAGEDQTTAAPGPARTGARLSGDEAAGIHNGEARMAQQGMWQQDGPERMSGLTDNPIDRYFRSFKEGSAQAADSWHWAYIYLDCWEQELEHAYELLNARAGQPAESYCVEAAASFVSFAQAESWLEAYFVESEDARMQEGRRAEYVKEAQEAAEGDMLTVNRIFVQIQLIRQQALRVYGLLEENSIEAEASCFVFDSQVTGTALEEIGRRR